MMIAPLPYPEQNVASLLQQQEYLAALHETALALMNRRNVGDLLQVLVARAGLLAGTLHGYVYLLTPDRRQLQMTVGAGVFSAQVGYRVGLHEGISGRVWASGLPVVVDDYQTWPSQSPALSSLGFHAVVGVPLTSGTQVVGVLGLAHLDPDCQFSHEMIDLLLRFAEIATIALDNTALYLAAQQELAERRLVEAALRESEERYRIVSALTSEFVYSLAVDEQGKTHLEWVSGAFPGLRRYKAEELNARGGWIAFVHPDDRAHVLRMTAQALHTETLVCQYRLLTRHGVRWVRTYSRSEKDVRLGRVVRILGAVQDITEKKEAEEARQQAEANYRSIFENAVEGIYQTTLDGHYLTVNPMLAQIHGYTSPAEMIAQVTDIAHQCYVDPSRRQDFISLMAQHNRVSNFEFQAYRKDGSIIWIAENARTMRDLAGRVVGFEGTVVDITARKQEAYRLHLQATALNAASSPMSIANARGQIEWVNAAFTTLTGYQVREVVGRNIRVLAAAGDNDPRIYERLWQRVCGGQVWRGELINQRKDGNSYTDDVTITPVLDERGQISQLISVHQDVTERKHYEQELAYRASHDPLTNLPNRRILLERLERAVELARTCAQSSVLLFLDLDRFKLVNDRLGHSAGDRLLVGLANIMTSQLHAGDLLARMGGDEFAVLLPNSQLSKGEAVARRLCSSAGSITLNLGGSIFHPNLSVGIALVDGAEAAETILGQADAAMYYSKQQGGDRTTLYQPPPGLSGPPVDGNRSPADQIAGGRGKE